VAAACSGRSVRLLALGVGLGQVGLAHLLDQHTPAREHLHESGNDGLQQRVQFLVGGRTGLDDSGHAIDVTAVHAVQDQAVQVDVEVGCGPEALDYLDGVAFVSDEPRSVQQVSRDHALHHPQHRYDQLGQRGQQHAQRDRQRQHPLAHRHVGDDVIDQVRCRLLHPARTA
jgi:hypothetical protein